MFYPAEGGVRISEQVTRAFYLFLPFDGALNDRIIVKVEAP